MITQTSNPDRTSSTPFSSDPLSVPYTGQARMRLVVGNGLASARVRIDPDAVELIRVEPDCGPAPVLRVNHDTVRLAWELSFGDRIRTMFGGVCSMPEIVLHPAVEWSLAIRAGLSDARLELADGRLSGLDIGGGCCEVDIELPAIARSIPIRIAGGASRVQLRRPAGIGVSVAITGGASAFQLDDDVYEACGGRAVLHGHGAGPGVPHYDIAVAGGASELAIL